MTIARRCQISLDHTPYYHCTTRCVRQAFLCGKDRFSGRSFDHRKGWMERRLRYLSRVFAIDLLAYAIMSNHYHVVVRINTDCLASLSDEDVVNRWGMIFAIPENVNADKITLWRKRLANLSWFMRCINEPIARKANREDRCTGRFWEGRFHCQALLDESSLLRCMVYVDLNPIRAAIAKTPETSSNTSIKARIERQDRHLTQFSDNAGGRNAFVPLRKQEYLMLVDWTGRRLQSNKRGKIPKHLPLILQRLGICNSLWVSEMKHYGTWYYRAVGSVHALERYCKHLGQNWLKGQVRLANTMT